MAQICANAARVRGAGHPLSAQCHPRGWGVRGGSAYLGWATGGVVNGDLVETEQSLSVEFGAGGGRDALAGLGESGGPVQAPSGGSSPTGKTSARVWGGGMSPKPGLLVLPAGLVLMGYQAVPNGVARLWDPQEKPPPEVHEGTGLGAQHPPPSSALALTQAQCRGQLGIETLSLNCCSSVPLAAPALPPAQRRSRCWGQPFSTWGYPRKESSPMGTRAHWHSACKDTGLGHTNPSAHGSLGAQQV